LHDSLLVKETDEDVYRQTFGCDTQGDRPSFVTETPNYQEMFSSTSMPNHNINLTPNSANLQNMHENQQRFWNTMKSSNNLLIYEIVVFDASIDRIKLLSLDRA